MKEKSINLVFFFLVSCSSIAFSVPNCSELHENLRNNVILQLKLLLSTPKLATLLAFASSFNTGSVSTCKRTTQLRYNTELMLERMVYYCSSKSRH